MKVTVLLKEVYGEQKAYPHCEMAHKFARLLGTKTLTRDALIQIKDIGYEIEVIFSSELFDTKTLTRDALRQIKDMGYEIEATFPSDANGLWNKKGA